MGVVEWLSSLRADRKIRKLLKGAQPRSFHELRERSFQRVIGSVQPHRARVLEAPLSGRLCAYYSIVVRAPIASGRLFITPRRSRTVYRTLADEHEGVPFELEDGGHRVVVDPTDAWISSGFDYKSRVDTARARTVVTRLGFELRVWDQILLQEAILAIGERVAVFGGGVFEPDREGVAQDQGYRDAGPMRFRFSGTERFPLVIRDDLQDL